MKYIIMGFLQFKLKELGLDMIDALILRYFVDFKASNAMKVMMVDNKAYYWVHYESVLKELPILNMKKCTIQSRFFKLRDAKVLSHHVKKEGGTFSYFSLGERYSELIATNKDDFHNMEEVDENSLGEKSASEGVDLNIHPVEKNSKGYQSKSITKDPSTKDPSNISLLPSQKDHGGEQVHIISQIIDYLNQATGKNYRKNTKATVRLIKARLNEGFTKEEFITVIDNMQYRWKGTKFQQYIAPSTLFGSKFDTYLNWGGKENEEEVNKEYCHGANKAVTFHDNWSNGTSYQGGDNKVNHLNSSIGMPPKEGRGKIELILREDM